MALRPASCWPPKSAHTKISGNRNFRSRNTDSSDLFSRLNRHSFLIDSSSSSTNALSEPRRRISSVRAKNKMSVKRHLSIRKLTIFSGLVVLCDDEEIFWAFRKPIVRQHTNDYKHSIATKGHVPETGRTEYLF